MSTRSAVLRASGSYCKCLVPIGHRLWPRSSCLTKVGAETQPGLPLAKPRTPAAGFACQRKGAFSFLPLHAETPPGPRQPRPAPAAPASPAHCRGSRRPPSMAFRSGGLALFWFKADILLSSKRACHPFTEQLPAALPAPWWCFCPTSGPLHASRPRASCG